MRGYRGPVFTLFHTESLTERLRRTIARLAPWGIGALALLAAVAHAMAALPTVDEHSGAARLRIPIDVPPGPGGLAPQLALTYSSLAGDGPFGVGWSLNLGEIRCTARFGVPDYANCPRYELDGQLLTEDPRNPNRYHTLVESFQKIQYYGSGGWAVTSTDGTMRRYGHTADSRIQADASTARWLLSELEDTFGNKIEITYDTDLDLGTAYPSMISYASGKREITFVYEPRPDPIHDFAGGIEREITHRVKEIQVTSYGEVFQRRTIEYDLPGTYSTRRSRLSRTQVFGTDCALSESNPTQNCTGLPAEEFEYTDPNDVLTTTTPGEQWDVQEGGSLYYQWILEPLSGPESIVVGDVNGDGLPDQIIGYSPPNGPDLTVRLSDGSNAETNPWTTSLRALKYKVPQMNATLARSNESPTQFMGICEASLENDAEELGVKFGAWWSRLDERPLYVVS